jgi:hypothetical protein
MADVAEPEAHIHAIQYPSDAFRITLPMNPVATLMASHNNEGKDDASRITLPMNSVATLMASHSNEGKDDASRITLFLLLLP